jgi:hypothetical protein
MDSSQGPEPAKKRLKVALRLQLTLTALRKGRSEKMRNGKSVSRISWAIFSVLAASLTPSFGAPEAGAAETGAGAESEIPDFNAALKQGLADPTTSAPCRETLSQPNPADSWTRNGFKNVKVESIPTEQFYSPTSKTKFTHGMELTAVLFRDSGWDRSEIEPRFKRVAEIYTQCGVKLSKLVYVEADPFEGRKNVDYSESHDDLIISKAIPETPRPAIFFVQSLQKPNGLISLAYSWRNGSIYPDTPIEVPLRNTAWISNDFKTNTRTTEERHKGEWTEKGAPYTVYDRSYSVDAHEIGHILTDSGHYEGKGKNFLAGDERKANDRINPQQCEAIRRHPLVKPL